MPGFCHVRCTAEQHLHTLSLGHTDECKSWRSVGQKAALKIRPIGNLQSPEEKHKATGLSFGVKNEGEW